MFHSTSLIPQIGTLLTLIPHILASPVTTRNNLIVRDTIASLLDKRAAPYQTRILDTATTFGEETDGTWQLIDADADSIPDLVFIKTSNTAGTVEVHIASASSNFQTRIWESVSTFGLETDGTWTAIPSKTGPKPDLAFIKTSDTAGTVEVHIASGASGYETRTLETTTTFGEETDGVWSLYDFDGDGILDLVFIKTSNTAGTIEVHIASGASNYQTRIFESGTVFGEETDGVWSLAPFSSIADLSFIKTSNTGSGTVEVHIASRASNYATRIQDVGTVFGEESDGVWSLIDFNRDGVLDLAFIKTQNTGSGTVEVHVASGN